MTKIVQFRKASKQDAPLLTDLAIKSKAYWGYSSDFMNAAKYELSVTPEDIEYIGLHYYVACISEKIVGFYSLEKQEKSKIELGAMFVDPNLIGSGIGKSLMTHAKVTAISFGAKKLIIQSDPNAEKFYRAVGGRNIGRRESESIPGRFLPVLEVLLIVEEFD